MRCRDCLDRFRIELTADSVTVSVNDRVQLRQTALPTMPSELIDGELFVYSGSVFARHPDPAIRFDWARLIVNPS